MPEGKKIVGLAVSGVVLCAVCILLSCPSSAMAVPMPCRYEVTVLQGPPLCSGQPLRTPAKAINENGDVAGDSFCIADARRPFFWTPETGLQLPPGPPGSSDSTVDAMNNLGEIVGTGNFPEILAYFRNAAGQYSIIHPLPGGTQTWGLGLNDAGQVVGYWGTPAAGDFWNAFIWQNGVFTDLGPLAGPIGRAYDINSVGQITGWTGSDYTIDGRAFIWRSGHLTILPPIPGGMSSQGDAINENGDVAGTGWFVAPIRHAYLWMDGQAFDLGTPPGIDRSIALDINNHRVVVGWASSHGWVWQNGVMRDLNTLIPPQPAYTIQSANSINDDGDIAASGSLGGIPGPIRGFILTPIYPSPADLNGDCAVNSLDLGLLLTNWSIPPTSPACRGVKPCPADLNGDGFVNSLDLGILLASWSVP